MWELRTKNRFGNIDKIYKETLFTKKPVYDNISIDGNSYNKANLTVQYTVEWLPDRNREAFEKSCFDSSTINPWELRDEYLTDSLGLAIRQLMIRELDSSSDNPHLYMYIKDKNGDDAEAVAELPSDTIWSLRNLIQSDINHRIDQYENSISDMAKEIELYKKFIKEYHAENVFDDFKRTNRGGDCNDGTM